MVKNPNLIKGGGRHLDRKTRLINDTIFFMCNGPLKVYMLFIYFPKMILKWENVQYINRLCRLHRLLLQRPSEKKRRETLLKSRRCS